MTKWTTTKQLNTVLANKLLQIVKAEIYYKTSHKTDVIDTETILENFKFLSESGAFVDCISWSYKKDYGTNHYICETGRMEGSSENIITLYLKVSDGVDDGDVEGILKIEEK